ncbi:MAG: manganese ABC transporter ATP-binding protein [Paracoccaceae bacterium]|nr:MAG: metal ABC transporter ATP-binding protein [Alphaproteobacteria bacterium]GIX13128.1 MAG: manganese ABC transporter ATP-binding protein [Paracoccaceae bacterium]
MRTGLAIPPGPELPPAPAEPALVIRDLTVTWGERPALISVDAAFPAGRLSAIIGPNGAGKSTLLKAVLGMVRPLSGRITVAGIPVARARDRIAYVPQRASVDWDFPVRVADVVEMGLWRRLGLLRRAGPAERARVAACLDRVGMAELAGRQIGRLSGGQQQRVFLARALVQEAELILLDEPFAGVDAATERAVIGVLKDLRAEGRTVIVVHHDLATVRDYFDHVLLLNRCSVAEGPVAQAFTADALQQTYGGRLPAAYLGQIGLGGQ